MEIWNQALPDIRMPDIRPLLDWSGTTQIKIRPQPDWSGGCLIKIRQLPDQSGPQFVRILQQEDVLYLPNHENFDIPNTEKQGGFFLLVFCHDNNFKKFQIVWQNWFFFENFKVFFIKKNVSDDLCTSLFIYLKFWIIFKVTKVTTKSYKRYYWTQKMA